MFTERYYQTDSKQAGLDNDNSIIVGPTGSGKSLVVAGIVKEVDHGCLVLQPSEEILRSNIAKAQSYGMNAKIYSASMRKREVGHVTYATIGSIIKNLQHFDHVRTLVIDEAHLVNPKGGMYEALIDQLPIERLIGLTATPYRQYSNSMGTSMRMITRTRPKIFKKISYAINPMELVKEGYLLMPKFIKYDSDKSMLRVNTTGAEYTDKSRQIYSLKNDLISQIIDTIKNIDNNHILVFVESVAESQALVKRLIAMGESAAEINAKTPRGERRHKLESFEGGDIRIMSNVGTLTTGYDFPGMDCIIDGQVTMSAAKHYQKTGRVVRPFEGKKPVVHDIAGNVNRLGNPLTYTIDKNSSGLHECYSERGRVTTRVLSNGPECYEPVTVGKWKDKNTKLCEVDTDYLKWAVNKFKGEWKHVFYSELKRRELFYGER